MQVHHKPTKILIGGKSGSGKTTYLIRYVQNSSFGRYWIFDHKHEFQNRLGLTTCYSLEEIGEKFAEGKEPRLSYHHSQEFPGDVESAFQAFCELAYELCKSLESEKDGSAGNSLFVCDEINRFTSATDLGFGFKQLIEDGRLQGLDLVATSHAANQISNRLRLQLTEIVALETHDVRPLMFLKESGFDPDEVANLVTGEFICKNCDTEEFTRGKLFSCASKKNTAIDGKQVSVNTENSEPSKTNVISKTREGSEPVHGDGSS